MSDPVAEEKARKAAEKEKRRAEFLALNPDKKTKAEKEAEKKKVATQHQDPQAGVESAPAAAAAPAAPADASAATAASPEEDAKAKAKAEKEARKAAFLAANPDKKTKAEKDATKAAAAPSPKKEEQQQQQQSPAAQSAPPPPPPPPPPPVKATPPWAQPESLAQLQMIPRPPVLIGGGGGGGGGASASGQSTHKRVAALGTLLSSRCIVGGNARLLATLDALCIAARSFVESHALDDMRVIEQLSAYLRHNLRFLDSCRPFTAGMKQVTDRMMRELGATELSAKALEASFQRLRSDLVDAITDAAAGAANLVQSGDIILTYGRSSAIELALCNLSRDPRAPKFSVIIVDAAPLYEGRSLLQKLREAGATSVSYCMLDAAVFAVNKATKVFVGASALMPNGQVLSRAGTAMVAIAAKYCRKPVFCVCETYKFTANMWQGNMTINQHDARRKKDSQQGSMNAAPLLYDLTPPGSVQFVVSEREVHEPTGIAAVVRNRELDVM